MPIRAELLHFYQGPAWQTIRARILARAAGPDGVPHCEQCGRPGGKLTERTRGGWWRIGPRSPWHDRNGEMDTLPPRGYAVAKTRCQLGVAHLDHNPANMDDGNLAALCRGCHLMHDQKHHYASARRSRAARAGQLWLAKEMEAP